MQRLDKNDFIHLVKGHAFGGMGVTSHQALTDRSKHGEQMYEREKEIGYPIRMFFFKYKKLKG